MDDYSPKDDYALAILSQAAMHAPDPNSFDQPAPNISTRPDRGQPLSITNQHNQNQPSNHERGPGVISTDADPFSDYSPTALPSRTVETLTYRTHASRPDVFMNPTYGGIGAGHYSDNLGILNAEQYDDSRSVMRSQEASKTRLKHQPEAPMPFGLTDDHQLGTRTEENEGAGNQRRKRTRAEMSNADEEDWAAKKARGRPRVDTKDETAADRRRTQIRMAQRAYRHRKETTISSLEKQVQELRTTNEEMSNTFIGLYDFAINKGLLQREPEFGQQLQSTIQRIIALAKSSSSEDGGGKDEEHQVEVGLKQDSIEAEPESGSRTKGRKSSPKAALLEPSPPFIPQIEPPQVNPWGGYELSKEETPRDGLELMYQQPQKHRATRHGDHQIISRATEDNASFPLDFMDLQQFRVEVPPIEDYSHNFFLQDTLPLPDSHSYRELSFARRIQRGTLEGAYKLITMQNPPPGMLQKVFGFCLLYETKDEVEARLKRCLGTSTETPLQEWRAPFVHLGGAGTFYPKYDNEEFMPKFRTGYSMGPQSQAVAIAQEKIQDPMRCSVPGFEGEFFDADDVEGYLRGRGLEIPPTADFVTVQLDFLLALSNMPTPESHSSGSIATVPSPKTPISPVGRIQGLLSPLTEQNPYDMDISNAGTNVAFNDKLPKSTFTLPVPLGVANWDGSTLPKPRNDSIDPIFDKVPDQNAGRNSDDIPNDGARTITLDVNILLQELQNSAVCTGRAPGFRLADVNAAIIKAIKTETGF